VADFLRSHRRVKILEELDDLLENEIKALAFDEKIDVEIIGKGDAGEWIGEYTPDKTAAVMAAVWPDFVPDPAPAAPPGIRVPERSPQLCPGCGHRSAFFAVRQALSQDDITVADIGCHTLGYLPPFEIGQVLVCMGASTAVGSGLALFNDRRSVVAFLGDSTFFHAGLPGIVNALFNRHDITLILMENGTMAMTGNQNHPASGRNFDEVTETLPVRQVLEGLGVKKIYETDAYRQAELVDLVRRAVADGTFSVVIVRHPCMLQFTRGQRHRPDYRPRRVAVDPQSCDRRHVCIAQFGCPTFSRGPDGSVTVNADLCIGDGSCVQTCPVKAISPAKSS